MQGYATEGGYFQQPPPPQGGQGPMQHMQQPQSVMGGLPNFSAQSNAGSPYQQGGHAPTPQQPQPHPMQQPPHDYPPSIDQRMQEEIQSVNAMLNTLSHAIRVFSEPPNGSSDHPTMDEVCQLYNLIVSLLQQDPNVHRLKLLLSNQGQDVNVFSVLFDCLRANFMYAPGTTSPNQMAFEFNRLRVTALRTLAKVISISSFDHYPSDPAVQQLSQLCARAVSASRGIETLLGIVCGGPQAGEEAKVAAVECLFVFAVRNSCGKQAIIDTPRSLHYFITALKTEESHTVRNYAAACIRELANTHPSHIIQCEFPEVVVDIVRTDSSADVRVLIIETLDLLLKADASYLTRFPLKSELAEILILLLDKDANKEVADISCRLLSTIFTTEGSQIALINHKDMPLNQLPVTFTTHWIEKEGYTVILEVVANSNQKVASMASIAFRHLVQHAPWQHQLGHKLIDHITTVGLLLNALKPGAAQPQSDDLKGQIPLVELSIALGLLFAQSPYTRSAIHRELCNYPALLPLLRSSIIANLNRPALQYYAKIDIIDITGNHLNTLLGIQWNESDGGPPIAKKASIRAIFQKQDARVKEPQPGRYDDRNIPVASTDYGDMEVQEQKIMRLTFVVLVYAICLGLSPGESAAPEQPAPAAGPGFSEAQGHQNMPPHAVPVPTPTATPTPGYHPQQGQPPHTPPAGSYQQPPHSQYGPPPGAGYHPPPPPPGGFAPPGHEGMHPPPPSYPPPPPQDPSRGLPASLRQGTPSGGINQSQFTGYTRVDPPYGVPPQAVTPAPTRSSILREQQTHNARLDRAMMRNAAPERSFTPHSAGHSMPRPGPGGSSRLYEPMFPTAGPPTINKSRELEVSAELQQTYSKFDNALRLTIHFAQYFNRKVDKKPTYKATGDGYMIRQSVIANPWTPVIKKNRLKSWAVKDLKEGDLFYFAIPFNELSSNAVEGVMGRARKHLTTSKKMFLITPQKAKGRRWFLFDILNNIIPGIQDKLDELNNLLIKHGEELVKFPLFMFREQELQGGERFLHPGNLLVVVDQIKFYFEQSPNDWNALVGENSKYIKDLDERMKALAKLEFTGYENDLSTSDSSSDLSSDLEDGQPSMMPHAGAVPSAGPIPSHILQDTDSDSDSD